MNKTHRVLAAVAAFLVSVTLAVACTGENTGPSSELDAALTDPQAHGHLRCYPQPYALGTALIGPGGGIVVVGRHRLIIPPKALDKFVLIMAEAPTDTINSVRFAPEGLTFNAGALPKLRMDYSNCPNARVVTKTVVYTDERLRVLEMLPTMDDAGNSDVVANLRHFSRYAIDY